MAVTTSEPSPIGAIFANAPRDAFAGAISAALSVAYGLSYAVLIFSDRLTPWLSYGIAATFLTTAIGGAVVAMRSSLPFTIAAPDSSISAVMGVLVAAVLDQAAVDLPGVAPIEPALLVIAISTALTGLFLCGLGLSRAGRAIRYVPYPVIGGFLGATGWVVISGAVRVVTDRPLTFGNLPALVDRQDLLKLAAGAVVALALHLGLRRSRNSLVLPGILLAFILAAQMAFVVIGIPFKEAQTEGWLLNTQGTAALQLPWHLDVLRQFPWYDLPALAGDLLAVMFVTAINMLLNTTGIEFATRREADLERDLNVLGVANLVSAALGGYISCTSVSRSTLNFAAGGRGRLSGLTAAAISAAIVFINSDFLAYVPKFVLGGLLLYLGLNLIFRWLIESAARLSWIEYVSLLAIALIIVKWGFIAGVLIGVVIGCATFALSASRVNAIKFSFDGSELRSSLDRRADDLAILAKHGSELQGMNLQSYLFFGSASRLHQHVKTLLASNPDCRFLLFDFRLVTGLDSSATHSFTQIKQAADDVGAQLVLVHLPSEVERALRTSRFIDSGIILAADIDHALESCEKVIIAAHRGEDAGTRTLTEWLTVALGNSDHAENLTRFCERQEFAAGERIAGQGEEADCMHFILEGRVGIIVEMPDGRSVRVRSLGPHTTIGEMGLITRQPRTASIRAEFDSVLYRLPLAAFERITAEHPALGQALLTYIVSVMSERLSFASRVIGVLRR
jgi:sulfate permease, SulP family